MKYEKRALTFEEQIEKLKSRGLRVRDEIKAREHLATVSYYRLRAYTYPFQDNDDPETPFIVDVSFEEIFKLYTFDHRLRSIFFEMLGIIEISFRTQIIYQYSLSYGSHWQLNPGIFRDTMKFVNHLTTLQEEIKRSDEKFISHYKEKYDDPTEPACWMSMEVSSFGLLSKIFQNLKNGEEKEQITKYFGLKKVAILENWLLCFSNLRNICAHHARLWNRRLTAKPKLPNDPIYPFIDNISGIYPNKLYATLCCMIYVLNIVRPENSYVLRIRDLIKKCPLDQIKEMGFPDGWETQSIWK